MKLLLFCVPYAGGLSSKYSRWRKYLDDSIELVPVQLAGREDKIDQPLYKTMEEAVDDVFYTIKDRLGEAPYAFFGHSMGSVIIFNLVYKLKELGYPMPKHIFFSGRNAPGYKFNLIKICNLTDKQFRRILKRLGGTPKEIFENKEFFEFFVPILRADFEIVDGFVYKKKEEKIDCPFTIMRGSGERAIKAYQFRKWRKFSSKPCQYYVFKGGHFFINERMPEVVQLINETLLSYTK